MMISILTQKFQVFDLVLVLLSLVSATRDSSGVAPCIGCLQHSLEHGRAILLQSVQELLLDRPVLQRLAHGIAGAQVLLVELGRELVWRLALEGGGVNAWGVS